MGDLQGNEFQIILREISGEFSTLPDSIQHLQKYGFINYFGMQRFGTSGIPTHVIGKTILQRKFREAVHLILCPREGGKKKKKIVEFSAEFYNYNFFPRNP